MVKGLLGHRLHANISDPDAPQDQYQAEAIVSLEVGEKIRIQPMGPISQCGRVVNDIASVQHVMTPTRGKNILDLFFTNENHLVENVEILRNTAVSDHDSIFITTKSGKDKFQV